MSVLIGRFDYCSHCGRYAEVTIGYLPLDGSLPFVFKSFEVAESKSKGDNKFIDDYNGLSAFFGQALKSRGLRLFWGSREIKIDDVKLLLQESYDRIEIPQKLQSGFRVDLQNTVWDDNESFEIGTFELTDFEEGR